MTDIAETLIDLLDGDYVRLETPRLEVATEVVEHERTTDGGTQGYTVRFMPIGEDATAVAADRYRVSVEVDGRGGWTVDELLAEVYVEAELDYETESRGELTAVEVLQGP